MRSFSPRILYLSCGTLLILLLCGLVTDSNATGGCHEPIKASSLKQFLIAAVQLLHQHQECLVQTPQNDVITPDLPTPAPWELMPPTQFVTHEASGIMIPLSAVPDRWLTVASTEPALEATLDAATTPGG